YDKARDAVSRGAEEAQRYVRDTTSGITGSSPSTAGASATTSGPSYSSGADSMRGAGSEPIRSTTSETTTTRGSTGSRRSAHDGTNTTARTHAHAILTSASP